MECVVLGAGGMMPMPQRLTTSLLVRSEGKMVMFDAGEGIQLALKRGGLGIRALDAVFISHLHADHILGLPGVMMFRAQCEDPTPLTIVGPPGVLRFVTNTIKDLQYRINYELEFVEWSKEAGPLAWAWENKRIYWAELEHSTFCLGYRIEEDSRPGKFDTQKAMDAGVPEGPLFGKIQRGEAIETPGGKTVTPEMVLGPARRGRVITFATDTRPCNGLSNLCTGADLAVVEGMFANKHHKEAAEKKHMTASQAARVAAQAGTKKLVLVHISPRYSLEEESILETEAREHFPTANVGRSLQTYPVPLPD